jgi:competence protein ComEC
LLLAGDAEKEAETAIESKYDSFLKSDILKISHHGSITGTSDLFLKSVRPQTAIISVGAKNKFNHPSPVVLQRIMELGCKYYRTDELGAIVLESDGERWNWIDWR